MEELPAEPAIIAWARDALSEAYADTLLGLIDGARRDLDVTAVLLTGSVARRDALPGTDIDVRVFVSSSRPPSFGRDDHGGVLLERTITTEEDARRTLLANPMHVYAYLDGTALYDPMDVVARLRVTAEQVRDAYAVPVEQKRALAEALSHPEEKARVAFAAGDLLKATYSLATSSWPLIEGLWAANDLPLPPNASVRAHLGDLVGPPEVERHFTTFFVGDPNARVESGLLLLSWIRSRLVPGD